jgi:undecaprenyl-diphosphatase
MAMRATGTIAAGPRRDTFGDARGAAVRLVLAFAVLWGVLCGSGYLLTHQLKGTSFEHWDGAANRRLARNRTDTWNTITHWLTYFGETLTVIAVCAVFFVGLRFALGRWRESMFLATAVTGQAIIFTLTTLVIERDRPSVPHLDSSPPTSSFPSGHMSASVTLYGGLAVIALRVSRKAWLRILAVAGGIAIPLCVGFARLYRGMHHLTDVSASVLLGLTVLTITWAVILRGRRGSRADAAP